MIQRLLVIANEPTPYNIDLFNAFVTAGIELKVFHTKAVSTRNYHYFSQYPVASYPTYIYRRAGFFNFIFALFTLFKKIYSSQFILITGTNSFLFRFSMLICILFKYPFFLWVDHVDLHQNIGNSVILKLIKKHLYLNVFKKAIAILTCGKPGMASVIKSGCPIIKLVDFPYTVDGNRLSLLAKQGSPIAVEALSRANGRIIIFYSGQMIARKGLDLLLMAFRSCIQEMSESAFLVIEGEGPLRLNFEKMAHKFGIFEKSFFVGFRQMDEHASLLGISDIVVVPSKYDPWGIVVHEGMLIKKPVIASDNVGSALDRITHGDNGYIFKSGDSEDLCKYLKLLLKNPELRLIIGKAAGNSAEKWPPSRNVENLLSAFVRSKKLL